MVHSKVSIIGAGLSGLVLGRALKQTGIKTCIFEKARKSPHRNNYGITLYEKSYRPLLNLLELDEGAFRRGVSVLGEGSRDGEEGGGMRVNRAKLEGLLSEGMEVKHEYELSHFESLPGSVELKFKRGGTRHSSPILVGADGSHSFVRQTILPKVELKVLPFATYNGKRTFSAQDWESSGLKTAFGGASKIETRVGSTLLQLSISNISSSSQEASEEILLSYTLSHPGPTTGSNDPLFRPNRSKEEAKTTPEELFTELGTLLPRLPEAYQKVFNPEAIRQDRILNWLQRSLHIDPSTPELKQAAEEGIVLMGDAVHAEPILGGQGANEAILDAFELADVISKGDGKLNDFYDRRAEAWQRSVRESEERIGEMHREGVKASL